MFVNNKELRDYHCYFDDLSFTHVKHTRVRENICVTLIRQLDIGARGYTYTSTAVPLSFVMD